jgi:hypothetical protein
LKLKSQRSDLNRRLAVLETAALPLSYAWPDLPIQPFEQFIDLCTPLSPQKQAFWEHYQIRISHPAHGHITPTSQKLQKKAMFVIIPAVESSGGDSLTSPDAGSEYIPSQGFETEVLSPL